MLSTPYEGEEKLPSHAPEIGIPKILYFYEMFPFWKAFFTELGYRVVLSDATHKELIRKGVENVVSETCFPIKVSHGHVLNFLEKGVKRTFLPSIVNLKPSHPEIPNTSACPYAQSFPYAIPSSIDFKKKDVKTFQPILHFGFGRDYLEKELIQFGESLHRGPKQVKKALEKAERFQALFYQSLLNRGKEVLDQVEKGVEVLLDALPAGLEKHPAGQVLFAGQMENGLGEQAYADRLGPRIRELERSGHWKFLGNLRPTEMAAFYPNLSVLVVPSLNSTEAFGLVQIEAMLSGVPCVASALPGVRMPVQMHGMGRIAAIGDPSSLAEAILDVLARPERFNGDLESIRRAYDPDNIAAQYEALSMRTKRSTVSPQQTSARPR